MKIFFKKIVIAIITWEAKMVLKKYKPQIVAVTGSVGKTSAKDAIYNVMSEKFYTRKSNKSYNSEFGVPLTVIGKESGWNSIYKWSKVVFEGLLLIFTPNVYPKWLILEVGADGPGDIEKVAKWIKPDVVVVTAMADIPVHVEFFDSREELVAEKTKLVEALLPGGVLVLNADDPDVLAMVEKAPAHTLFSYGSSDKASVVASHITTSYEHQKEGKVPMGITFRADYAGKSVPITTKGVLGEQLVYPLLASIAVGISQKINLIEIAETIKHFRGPRGRMNIIEGTDDSLIIDDSYNSSPLATEAALKTLGSIEGYSRKISVLGDMKELGKHSIEAHSKIGKLASQMSDICIFIGPEMKEAEKAAAKSGGEGVKHFDNSDQAAKYMFEIIRKGDAVVVKGSQSVRTERVVEAIMANSKHKKRLLVRQEREWVGR